MTLDFVGKTLDYYEHLFLNNPYIGYISPNGLLIDHNFQHDSLHSEFGTLISWTFLLWIIQNELLNDSPRMDIFLNQNTGEIKNINIRITDNEKVMQKDLLEFLKLARNDIYFIQSIKDKISTTQLSNSKDILTIEKYLGNNNTKQLLLYLKDICIQYLGYDSIERINPNIESPSSPTYYQKNDIKKLNYVEKPRIITTSNHNINERFYNYILMDWIIQRLPKYIYNEQTGLFEQEPPYTFLYESEAEQNLAKELKSIKKLVPIKERTKFFR